MKHMSTITKSLDNKGRLHLGAEWAGRTVLIDKISATEVRVELARVIPEREAWLYENPEALGAVRRGLEQAKAGEFVDGPDLDADAAFADSIDDDE